MLVLGWLCCGLAASASDTRDHLINGPSDQRVDIAVLGDGFTEQQRDSFFTAAQNIAEEFLGEPPFPSYRAHFNVRLLFTASNEAGADDPSQNVFRDTAFGARFDCFSIARLLCIDSGAVSRELAERLDADQHDIVLVIVNDAQYGGSGGSYATASLHPLSSSIAIHELGHSFGRLADEYEADQATCDFYNLGARAPNIEDNTVRALIKWNTNGGPPSGWIDAARPLPSTDQTPSLPGLYDGAALCPKGSGLYRPTLNSKMRTLDQPFDPINNEQLVLRIYQESGLIVNSGAASKSVFAFGAGMMEFSQTVVGNPALLNYSWMRGNEELSSSASLSEEALTTGVTDLEFRVEDASGFIRYDSAGHAQAVRRFFLAYADEVEVEPNDEPESAQYLTDSVSISGTLGADSSDVVDFFLLEAPPIGRVQLRAAALGPDAVETSLIIRSTSDSWSQTHTIRSSGLTTVFDTSLPAGTYTVELSSPAPAAFSLVLAYFEVETAPGVPRVQVHDLGVGSITLRVLPAEREIVEVAAYEATCSFADEEVQVEGSGPLLEITGLDENNAYQCSVKALNSFGASAAYELPETLTPTSTSTGLPLWLFLKSMKDSEG
ncbi:MAG: M64 family metallopeptidase [Pseudomonadota bacterium]